MISNKTFLCLVFITAPLPLSAKEALYSVPTPDERPELKPYAESMAEGVKFELKKGRAHLEYKLPTILTGGETKKIRLESQTILNQNKIVLDGEGAMGICRPSEINPSRYDCELDYEKDVLLLDKTKIDEFITSQTISPADLKPQLEIGELFYNEARGILHDLTLKSKIKFD